MIAKEWRDAGWKIGIVAALVLFAALVSPVPTPYEEISSYAPSRVDQFATIEMWGTYSAGGFIVLLPLAAVLGVALISGESILFLLSKPVSRTRLMTVKYAVCAGGLLTAAISGAVLVVIVAATRGYPVNRLVDVPGVALSVLLLWLGSLFVLGVALLASVVFRNVVASVAATVLTLYVILGLSPEFLLSLFYEYQARYTDVRPGMERPGAIETAIQNLNLARNWTSEGLFTGESFAATNFVVCFVAAAVPLLIALWVFRRKAY